MSRDDAAHCSMTRVVVAAVVAATLLAAVAAVEKYGSDMKPIEPVAVDAPEVVSAATVRVYSRRPLRGT